MYREKQDYAGDLGIAEAIGRLSRVQKMGMGCLGLIVSWIAVGLVLGGGGESGPAGAAMSCASSADGLETCTRPADLDECLGVIRRTGDELGVAPINIVETTDMRVVRFPASDGSVLVKCTQGEMALIRSPHSGS